MYDFNELHDLINDMKNQVLRERAIEVYLELDDATEGEYEGWDLDSTELLYEELMGLINIDREGVIAYGDESQKLGQLVTRFSHSKGRVFGDMKLGEEIGGGNTVSDVAQAVHDVTDEIEWRQNNRENFVHFPNLAEKADQVLANKLAEAYETAFPTDEDEMVTA